MTFGSGGVVDPDFPTASRRGCRVWKSVMGRSVLTLKVSKMEDAVVVSKGVKSDVPALIIRTSSFVMWCVSVRVLSSAAGEFSADVERCAMMSLLVCVSGRAWSASMDVVVERTVAMTVVLGRRRRMDVRARPMPVCVQMER